MSLIRRKPFTWWSKYYETMLVDMWEKNIRIMKAGKSNMAIYKMMAQKLDDAGFIEIEWKAVRTKIENLTRKYRTQAMEPVSHWIHFKRLHKMLKCCRPKKPPSPDKSFKEIKTEYEDIKTEYEETEYLSEYLQDNPEILEGKHGDQSWEDQMDLLSHSETLNGDQTTRRSTGQDEMTPFEAGMLAASRERNRELQKLREELTDLGRQRLSILERLEKTMNRMEEGNAKFHQQMLEKKS